jgi:hypothetical protein
LRLRPCGDITIGRLWGIYVFKHQAQLRDIHLPGTATKLDAQQPCEAMLQLFDLQALGLDGLSGRLQLAAPHLHGLGHLPQHFLQKNRVCGKAIKVEPHASD